LRLNPIPKVKLLLIFFIVGKNDDWNYAKEPQNVTFVSAIFSSITDFPIRHQKKILPHVFEDMDEILLSLRGFYVSETLRQIYKIIGSFDFVGNPNVAFNDLLTGVRDFFVEPSVAFLKSPSRLGVGVAKCFVVRTVCVVNG